jgi:superfamily II DNA/RNA helicase
MGFDRELRSIVQSLPDTRQTLLFSATLTKVRARVQVEGLKFFLYLTLFEERARTGAVVAQVARVTCLRPLCLADIVHRMTPHFVGIAGYMTRPLPRRRRASASTT